MLPFANFMIQLKKLSAVLPVLMSPEVGTQ